MCKNPIDTQPEKWCHEVTWLSQGLTEAERSPLVGLIYICTCIQLQWAYPTMNNQFRFSHAESPSYYWKWSLMTCWFNIPSLASARSKHIKELIFCQLSNCTSHSRTWFSQSCHLTCLTTGLLLVLRLHCAILSLRPFGIDIWSGLTPSPLPVPFHGAPCLSFNALPLTSWNLILYLLSEVKRESGGTIVHELEMWRLGWHEVSLSAMTPE